MNIQALYLEIEKDEFLRATLSGNLVLKGNCIIWSYELYESPSDENNINSYNNEEDDEDDLYGFERTSNEEILLETYRDDAEEIRDFLEELDGDSSWEFTEPEIFDDMISFKIY